MFLCTVKHKEEIIGSSKNLTQEEISELPLRFFFFSETLGLHGAFAVFMTSPWVLLMFFQNIFGCLDVYSGSSATSLSSLAQSLINNQFHCQLISLSVINFYLLSAVT